MIGSLRGILLDRVPRPGGGAEVIVEVGGGVGYRAIVPSATAGLLGELGGQVFLHVHTHVREDAIILYGFPTREERVTFEVLIAAHGIGPAMGLSILSVHSPVALRRIVATEDADALSMVPGIGKKTALRLLIDLASKLDIDLDPSDPGLVIVGDRAGAPGAAMSGRSAVTDVRAALAGLGYGADEVRDALVGLGPEGSVEDLLRAALKTLAGSR